MFEEADENKLEYTQIFDDYFKIMDEVIERILRDKYLKDEVMAFYGSFAEKIEQYKELKPDSVN